MNEIKSELTKIDNNKFLSLSKRDIEHIVNQVETSLLDGYADPVASLVLGKKLQALSESYNKSIRQLVSGKIKIQKGVPYEAHGASITEEETGVRYDYSYCNDGIWNGLSDQIEPLLEARKKREEFLKTIRKEFIDEDTGKIIQPPLRTGSLSYKLTLKSK